MAVTRLGMALPRAAAQDSAAQWRRAAGVKSVRLVRAGRRPAVTIKRAGRKVIITPAAALYDLAVRT